MFKVTVHNEEDEKFIPIMEYGINETYKKILGAKVMYGDNVINYLIQTEQTELLRDAINGKLDDTEIMMDKETYERIYNTRRE